MQRVHPIQYEAMIYNQQTKRADPPIKITEEQIQDFNSRGYDIYWNWNYCNPVRGNENLECIYSFFVDIDGDKDGRTKEDLTKVILKSPLAPSTCIETNGGFHLYWDLKEPLDTRSNPILYAERFREFVKNRLIPFYGGDKQAADASRLLRVPMTRYLGLKEDKRSDEVVEVKLHFGNVKDYSLEEIKEAFPEIKKEVSSVVPDSNKPEEDKFVWSKAVMDWLILLSGSSHVRGETYTFKKENYMNVDVRIYVNHKRSNAWIDKEGKIGSTDNAAPSILQWLMWYGHSKEKSYEIMRSLDAPQGSR